MALAFLRILHILDAKLPSLSRAWCWPFFFFDSEELVDVVLFRLLNLQICLTTVRQILANLAGCIFSELKVWTMWSRLISALNVIINFGTNQNTSSKTRNVCTKNCWKIRKKLEKKFYCVSYKPYDVFAGNWDFQFSSLPHF